MVGSSRLYELVHEVTLVELTMLWEDTVLGDGSVGRSAG